MSAHRFVFILAFLISLVSCAPLPPAPQPFTGPVAHLQLTAKRVGLNSEDYIFLPAINGGAYYMTMAQAVPYTDIKYEDTVFSEADIPAGQPTRISLRGHTVFSAPIFCMAGTDYAISGDITFTPIAGKTYVAKGEFGPNESAVWIEDTDTHAIMGKIVVNGSTAIPTSSKLLGGGGVCPLDHVDF